MPVAVQQRQLRRRQRRPPRQLRQLPGEGGGAGGDVPVELLASAKRGRKIKINH